MWGKYARPEPLVRFRSIIILGNLLQAPALAQRLRGKRYMFFLSTISILSTSTLAVESRRCIKVSYRP